MPASMPPGPFRIHENSIDSRCPVADVQATLLFVCGVFLTDPHIEGRDLAARLLIVASLGLACDPMSERVCSEGGLGRVREQELQTFAPFVAVEFLGMQRDR
jgi:hypothetical protein